MTNEELQQTAVERGPNYDWKHEAEHYREECEKLRTLLRQVEASGERDASERDDLRRQLETVTAERDKARAESYAYIEGSAEWEYEAKTAKKDLTESQAALAKSEAILRRVAEYGPPQGEKVDSAACAFCDMGGAGYASRGDGFHDDNCAVKDAQLALSEQPTLPLVEAVNEAFRHVSFTHHQVSAYRDAGKEKIDVAKLAPAVERAAEVLARTLKALGVSG